MTGWFLAGCGRVKDPPLQGSAAGKCVLLDKDNKYFYNILRKQTRRIFLWQNC
jgi:hypothetical protein